MPVIKYRHNNAKSLYDSLEYALRCQKDGAPAFGENVDTDASTAASTFKSVQQAYGFKGKQQYVSMIMSFSPEESKRMTMEDVNAFGVELTRKHFKGYQFVVGTHNDTDHLHNHIIINRIHPESGKLIQNKLQTNALRALANTMAIQKGLEVVKPDKTKRIDKEGYDLTQKRIKYDSYPFVKDLKQKNNFAMNYSTDFNEYATILSQLNVGVRVEKKNISYFYADRKRPVRGKYLGDQFERKELIKTFAVNEQRFSKHPELRKDMAGKINGFRNERRDHERDTSNIPMQPRLDAPEKQKANEKFVSPSRRSSRTMLASDRELSTVFFPISELKSAQQKSIPDYCKRNNIPLLSNQDGTFTLKGRDYVQIHESHWFNTKNSTKGSLVELVAIHKNVSFINAISQINNNPNLLLLERHYGKEKNDYKSFHIPITNRKDQKSSLESLHSLFKSHNFDQNKVNPFYESKQFQVKKDGTILMFSEDDKQGAYQFTKDSKDNWKKEQFGKFNSPFKSKSKNSSKLLVMTNPFQYIQSDKKMSSSLEKSDKSFLVMMDEDQDVLDKFIAGNKSVKAVQFLVPNSNKKSQSLDLFINKAKKHLNKFGLTVETTTQDSVEKSKDRLDVDFN